MNVPPNDTPKEVEALINMATDVNEILNNVAAIKGKGYANALNSLFNIQTGFMVCGGLLGPAKDEREQAAVDMVHKLGDMTVAHATKAFVECLVPAPKETAEPLMHYVHTEKCNKLLGEMIDDLELLFKKHDQHVSSVAPGANK